MKETLQFPIRFDLANKTHKEVLKRLRGEAEKNGRSQNSELIQILKNHFGVASEGEK